MPLKTTIKVSHISNLSDARYCAGMGVEMLGFRVIPGKQDFMTPELFQDIRGWISGPRIIAELYGLSDREQVETAIQTYAPDYFELTYAEYRIFNEFLTLPCIVYFPAVSQIESVSPDGKILYLLTDENTTCRDLAATELPVLKTISSLHALTESLTAGCYKGFVLKGPREQRPGVTNYDELGDILEALEED